MKNILPGFPIYSFAPVEIYNRKNFDNKDARVAGKSIPFPSPLHWDT